MDEPFDTTTQRKVSIESGSAAETRLPDRWLPLARLTWGIVAVLTLTVFIASLPLYLALTHREQDHVISVVRDKIVPMIKHIKRTGT